MPPDQLFKQIKTMSSNTLAMLNRDLRPKVMIYLKDLNAKLDASGRYTKKILGIIILLLIVIYEYTGRSSQGSPVNEFRAHAVITMEDHLKNQAIRAQLESQINETESDEGVETPIVLENDTIPKELAQKIVDSWAKVEEEPVQVMEIEEEEEEIPLVEEERYEEIPLGENEFRPFGGPDLSNLPEEIPIPGGDSETGKTDYTINVPPPAQLNVVESMGSEEIQHKRQLAVKKACYMPRLRYNVYNQTSRFYSLDDLQPDDFKLRLFYTQWQKVNFL